MQSAVQRVSSHLNNLRDLRTFLMLVILNAVDPHDDLHTFWLHHMNNA